MKFSTALISAALVAFAAAQTTTSTSEIPKTTQEICLEDCGDSDVTCRAGCLGVPRPNEEQIAETDKCSRACDQGEGSPEDIEAYGQCLLACVDSHFLPTSVGGTAPTGSGAAPTGTDGAGSGDDNEDGEEGSGNGGNGGNTTDPANNDEGAASSITVGTSVVGMVAIIAAALAL
jgi:hypothetical protein